MASSPSRATKRLRALLGAEQRRVERERREPLRVARHRIEPRRKLRPAFGQRGAQRAVAVPRQREQLVFGQAEQRALEHGREREVVVRQQQGVGQRQQVHHRDMVGQHQPVGAGDVDVLVLQRADDRLEQRPALAHQHEDVARPHVVALVAGADAVLAIDPQPHRLGDLARELDARARLRGLVERLIPRLDLLALLRLHDRPELDEARAPRRARPDAAEMPAVVGGHAAIDDLRAANTCCTAVSTLSFERNE